MADRVAALLEQAPHLQRAALLDGPKLPVHEAFERLLPDGGLRSGTSTQVCGIGATTLALALVARASQDAWTAVVGMPSLGLRAAAELGIDLDHLVAIPDPGKRWTDVLGAALDAFDIVLARPQLPQREARQVAGRVRERDAVFVTVGPFDGSDVRIETSPVTWDGIEDGPSGNGHLAARRMDVHVTGRRGAALGTRATLWLPDRDGNVSVAEPDNVVRLAR